MALDSVFLFVIALFQSCVATVLFYRFGERLGLVDVPNPIVPQHKKPVVKMGGIAIALATWATMFGFFPFSDGPSSNVQWRQLLPSGVAFLALGIADDLLRLSARAKFVGQCFVAALAISSGLSFSFTGQPGIDMPLAFGLILLLVNASNLTDVCDGLVTGLMTVAFLFISFLSTDGNPWGIASAGACAGFLLFNAPPARIFLGDSGSHWLGFMLAALLLAQPAPESTWQKFNSFLLIPAVFLIEVTLLIVARHFKRIPFWEASPDHFSLRMQKMGISRWSTVLSAWAVAIFFGAITVFGGHQRPGIQFLVLCLSGCMMLLAVGGLLRIGANSESPGRQVAVTRRLLWIDQAFASSEQTGNERSVHIVSALVECGWAVDLVTSQTPSLRRQSVPSPIVIESENCLTIHRLRCGEACQKNWRFQCNFVLRSFFYLHRFRRVDLVYLSAPPRWQLFIGLFAAVVRRAPVVLELRDFWPLLLTRRNDVLGRLLSSVTACVDGFFCRVAQQVIWVGPGSSKYVESFGVDPAKIAILPTDDVVANSDAREEKETIQHPPGRLTAIASARRIAKVVDTAARRFQPGSQSFHTAKAAAAATIRVLQERPQKAVQEIIQQKAGCNDAGRMPDWLKSDYYSDDELFPLAVPELLSRTTFDRAKADKG